MTMTASARRQKAASMAVRMSADLFGILRLWIHRHCGGCSGNGGGGDGDGDASDGGDGDADGGATAMPPPRRVRWQRRGRRVLDAPPLPGAAAPVKPTGSC